MTVCIRCKQRSVQDAYICTTCYRDAEKALAIVPDIAWELNLTIARQSRFTSPTEIRGNSETPAPFGISASDSRDVLRNILVGWTKLYAEECRARLPADTLTAMSRFLAKRCDWFRRHDLALDFVNEITWSVGRCKAAIDVPRRPGIFVGPCPDPGCPGQVRAYLPTSEDEPAHMDCDECNETWPSWEWRRTARKIKRRLAGLRAGA